MNGDKDIVAKMRANVRAMQAQGAPVEDIQREVAYWDSKLDAISAEERKLSPLQKTGAAAQTFSDALTLGLGGVATDALAPGSFSANRQARKMAKGQLAEENPMLSIGTELAGAAVPMLLTGGAAGGGSLLRAAPTASRLARGGTAIADAALQSGISGTANTLEGGTTEDLKEALGAGAQSAVLGGGVAAGVGGVAGAVSKAASRIKSTNALDDAAVKLSEKISKVNKAGYDQVLSQPAQKQLTKPMLDVLTKPDVLPLVKKLQTLEQWRGVRPMDPKFLDNVYKELSEQGVKIEKILDGDIADRTLGNVLRSEKKHIDILKGQFLDAMDQQVPGYRGVVREARKLAEEAKAFEGGADIAKSTGAGKSLSGKKLRHESEAAYLKKIPDMSPEEAELALSGVLGRGREAVHITSSPLGAFGTLASGVRVPLQAFRTKAIVEALEKQAGKKHNNLEVSAKVRGLLARTAGAEQGRQGLFDRY